jgi:soluble lytic murein transglycosylase
MTMRIYSVRTIPALLLRLSIRLALPAAILASVAAPQDLASLVKAYRESPSVVRRSRIQRIAAAHPSDQTGALARFALGVTSLEQKDYERAVMDLKVALPRLPKLQDYTAYYLASAQLQQKQYSGSAASLARFRELPVPSPLQARATVLEAKALAESGSAQQAVQMIREKYQNLPQPDTDFTLATAYQAAADRVNAAIYYQRVYYEYPNSDLAATASAALIDLRNAMGPEYPAAAGGLRLERADKWLASGDYSRARQEYTTLVTELSGLERDQARVRMGATDFMRGETAAPYRYLQSLDLPSSEADAERFYYLAECQRRNKDDDDLLDTLKRFEKKYAKSPWRLKALFSAANHFLVINRPQVFEALYKSVYEDFPSHSLASYCHWKVAWGAYLRRRDDARERMREHLEKYPTDVRASGALYFLGRLGESAKDFAASRAYYEKIVDVFPNYYYSVLARQRLADAQIVAATPAPKVVEFLGTIQFSERKESPSLEASPATKLRIERARLLETAGFSDFAEPELRFGARNDGQALLLAMELARSATAPHMSLHYMKTLAPDYLATPFERMPRRFWELLFPMPYQRDLVANARLQNLDPYMVAALIRQESEFNPSAVSHKSAYGLTQIMPATGRQLARRTGVRRFRKSMLLQPATNLKLGSKYLRSMLDEWGGKWEETLASYNAGKSRVDEWLSWDVYREPAEFVETIPFTETRDYVQAVLRNAAMYRRLYGTAGLKTDLAKSPSDRRSANRNASARRGAKKHRAS